MVKSFPWKSGWLANRRKNWKMLKRNIEGIIAHGVLFRCQCGNDLLTSEQKKRLRSQRRDDHRLIAWLTYKQNSDRLNSCIKNKFQARTEEWAHLPRGLQTRSIHQTADNHPSLEPRCYWTIDCHLHPNQWRHHQRNLPNLKNPE